MKTNLQDSSCDVDDIVFELLKQTPFLTMSAIAKGLGVGYNTAKKIMDDYAKNNELFQLDWWTDTVFCVNDFDWPYQLMTKNFLLVRDRVIKKIQSNKTIRNSYAVTEFLREFDLKSIRKIPKEVFDKDLPEYPKDRLDIETRDQVFLKYLHLWMLLNKILLFEKERFHNNILGFSASLLDKRNRQLLQLFLEIDSFLRVNYIQSCPIDSILAERAKELDERYEAYKYRYKELRFGQLPLAVIIWTAYYSLLQTPKDASEKFKVGLDQVYNRFGAFVERGKFQKEKIRGALIAESADNELFIDHGHLDWLLYVLEARKELEQIKKRLKYPKKSSIYRKVKKRSKQVFPDMTIDPLMGTSASSQLWLPILPV